MDVKKMREELATVVDTVPRKNEDVIAMYNEKFKTIDSHDEISNAADVSLGNVIAMQKPSDNTYTYVGAGEEPPHQIKFMDIQVFTRGQATEVTNPAVLAKIKTNRSFVKGSVDADTMYEADQKAKKEADLQREEDVKVQIEAEREQRKA